MTDIYKNNIIAEQDSSSINTQAEAIDEAGNVSDTQTNLSVMENMQNVVARMNACVNDYKKLSYDDAEAILAVYEEHRNTDAEMAGQMK